MELRKIDESTYLAFALKNEYISIYQLPGWGKLKEKTGWISHLLGLYDDASLVGVTLLLEKKVPLKLSLFYAPRGFLIDVKNKELLTIFTNEVTKYIKKYHGFMLKADPNVIYATYDENGENKEVVGDQIFQNFKELKYKHSGFTKNFETLQPRFLCRFKLEDTYEKTVAKFAKNTRKHIEKTEKMGVKVRAIDINEMDLFVSLLQETGNLKNFIVRPASYYERMYENLKEYMKLYITYIDTNEYNAYLIKEIEATKKELEHIEKEKKTAHVGNKLLTRSAQNEQKLERLEKALEEAKNLRKTNDKINIGALMSLFVGNEGITFMSGTSALYKNFNPKYAFYNEHIKECIKEKKEYCNFYGISGEIDPKNPYYSIYEIKKGFKPEIIELIGEFDLITNRVGYYLYHIALKGYKIVKKIKRR